MPDKLKKVFISRRTRQILVKSIILVLAALFLTWLLEYRHFLNNPAATWEFVSARSKVFLYNSLIMLTLLIIIYGIFRKTFMSISIGAALVLIVGYIHISKFNFRGVPLMPEDFQLTSQAGTLTKFVDFSQIVRLIVAVILIIILGKILDNLTSKWLKKESVAPSNTWWRRYRLVSRIAIIAVGFSGFMVTTDFIRHHSGEREIELPILSSKFTDWNQVTNYADNGFLMGFLYNTTKLVISEPDGYSKQKIAEINNKLDNLKAAADTDRTNISEKSYNIISILNESFYDPSIISEYYKYSGGDVTPNLHVLQQRTLHGNMYSPDYGGGTANIEYEIVTGLTNYWFKTVPYTNLIPRQASIPSMASYLREQGLNTATIHPFNAGMYRRETVLPKLGFNLFYSQEQFKNQEKEGTSEYINDRSAYSETLEYIKSTDSKDYVSLITMQNHAPYTTNEYGESEFNVTNIDNVSEKNAVETYLMTLHKADEFLGEFIAKLDQFDEDTVVLFYGDHSPGVFPRVIENSDKSISDLARLTPYFIYANFDLDVTENELPVTTPNCLPNTLLNILGVEKPKTFYLLDTICTENPILTDSYFAGKAPLQSTELSEYQLLTYDLVAGKQYSTKK